MKPWVGVPTICSLSLSTLFVLGERARVRGGAPSPFANSCFVPRKCLENNEPQDSPLP